MAFPEYAEFVVVGAGIHGLATAWRLAERLTERNETVEGRIIVLDKSGIAAGASGIACGVVRNNYFQPAMRNLMAHSVGVWESDPEAFSYHPVGYMQISCEAMRDDVAQIFAEQQAIGYESVFIEGANAATSYMRGLFDDWQAQAITSVLHEKRGGYANNTTSIYGLAKKAEDLGVRIITGVEVKGFVSDNGSKAVRAVETDKGPIRCDRVIIGAGPWVRNFWDMLGLPKQITVKDLKGNVREGIDMWRFWQLEEGLLRVDPGMLLTNGGKMPPVIHVDTDAPLISDVDGSTITDKMWGIYYKPDWHFGGVQGGAAPYKVDTPVDEVQIDPYGPDSPEFVSGPAFAHMWVSALAHCHKRFEGMMPKYHREPSGGIGCFTPDSFPVFDHFNENATVIADSNHGYKMLGVGRLIADEVMGEEQELLKPFRFDRFEKGELHPTSHSPFPWS
ncbi:FAD-binding oxidoreductase [Aurantimonas sp. C2-6-R+9]|uniref:NAD(P)/FAD-dependent oxidoreductase n=1 Tax=unclassified Aurantimonas TaxID=2638230 RepID=UPI002E19859E|nr:MULTISPECIES: FAD-binding oxidoreductase [unclassified Aurantimonas]MEC5292362.1 FAD-binding oxidoreductase [Aurantimonas sp. C2-3-R2]MEC5322209.1 FAD-binding oxidoreductase [Aurantimonas sp. A3-2-R12]MEC5382515.1 FAD-binding oxidoreductase [Aurantimonas sp. C2-6-R+9]MEC5411853.1 FAD-binding oxidoreductase [Aurantimonas sp. C2-4-R8]